MWLGASRPAILGASISAVFRVVVVLISLCAMGRPVLGLLLMDSRIRFVWTAIVLVVCLVRLCGLVCGRCWIC